jgi:hypothetical protein
MFEVNWKDNDVDCQRQFENLDAAIQWSKELNKFVTINFDGNQLVGKFGVDSVESGCLPGGDDYTWKKRRR